jgi:hypothetical protein
MLLAAINFVVTAKGPYPINTSSDLPSQHRLHGAGFLAKRAKTIETHGEKCYRDVYDLLYGSD